MAVNATWVWVRENRPVDPDAAARFARDHGVRTAWVSVPWAGPDERVRAVAQALRLHGIAVVALGGSPDWAEHPERAGDWARRATAGNAFGSVHLDIEAWTLPHWSTDADRLLSGTEAAVRLATTATGSAVEIDLAPHLARTHPHGFATVARAAGAVTLMSYRASSPAILALASPAVKALRVVGRPYRLAVDTLPSTNPDTTFAGRHTAYLQAVVTDVAGELAADPRFRGVAMHDLRGWQDLPRTGS